MPQLNPKESYELLVAQVHAPVFFTKLAKDYGIQAQTQEDVNELMLLARTLRQAHEQNAVKEASARTNSISEARKRLDQVLGATGYDVPNQNDAARKKMAAAAAKNPLLCEAAVVFANHLARAQEQAS